MLSKVFQTFFKKSKNLKINQKQFSEIVKIPYEDLVKNTNINVLFDKIETAYGMDGLGILIIEKVPEVLKARNKLLTLTSQLVKLPKDSLKSLERPEINYALGWSYGKEYFNDKPDLLKASYYAQLLSMSMANQTDKNLWPQELPELKSAFYEMGGIMRSNGLILFSIIDKYIKKRFPKYGLDYPSLIKESNMNTGRMLYYFPKKFAKGHNVDTDNWCEWHNDHGSLTGLVSSVYLDEKGNEAKVNLTETGLYIQNRKGEVIRVTFGKEDLAYQVGETLQIHSGGILHATPHAVKVLNDIPEDIARVTFALFMEPNYNEKLNIPEGAKIEDVKTSQIYKVPKVQDRFIPGMTFGEFTDATYNKFYK
jgi:isopenicillin N synthase-like dioxygenase